MSLGLLRPAFGQEQKICVKKLDAKAAVSIRLPVSLELIEVIVDFLREEAKHFGCLNMHTTGFSIRDTYLYLASHLEDAEAVKGQMVEIEWGKSDFGNRLRKSNARGRIVNGFEILRDNLRPDLKFSELTREVVNEVVNTYRNLPSNLNRATDPAVRRRARSVHLRGEMQPIRQQSPNAISFATSVASQYESELKDLANSFTGVVLEGSGYRATILSSRSLATQPRHYFLAAVSRDANGQPRVENLVLLNQDSAPLIWGFWGNVAKDLGYTDRITTLSYNRKNGGLWEGPIKIPGEVAAKVKFKNDINIEQIENWISRYQLESLTAGLDKVAVYHLSSVDNLPKLRMKAVVKDGILTMTDLDVE